MESDAAATSALGDRKEPKPSVPSDILRAVRRAVRKRGVAMVIFRRHDGTYIAVTVDDTEKLATYRGHSTTRELMTVEPRPPALKRAAPKREAPKRTAPKRKASKDKTPAKRTKRDEVTDATETDAPASEPPALLSAEELRAIPNELLDDFDRAYIAVHYDGFFPLFDEDGLIEDPSPADGDLIVHFNDNKRTEYRAYRKDGDGKLQAMRGGRFMFRDVDEMIRQRGEWVFKPRTTEASSEARKRTEAERNAAERNETARRVLAAGARSVPPDERDDFDDWLLAQNDEGFYPLFDGEHLWESPAPADGDVLALFRDGTRTYYRLIVRHRPGRRVRLQAASLDADGGIAFANVDELWEQDGLWAFKPQAKPAAPTGSHDTHHDTARTAAMPKHAEPTLTPEHGEALFASLPSLEYPKKPPPPGERARTATNIQAERMMSIGFLPLLDPDRGTFNPLAREGDTLVMIDAVNMTKYRLYFDTEAGERVVVAVPNDPHDERVRLRPREPMNPNDGPNAIWMFEPSGPEKVGTAAGTGSAAEPLPDIGSYEASIERYAREVETALNEQSPDLSATRVAAVRGFLHALRVDGHQPVIDPDDHTDFNPRLRTGDVLVQHTNSGRMRFVAQVIRGAKITGADSIRTVLAIEQGKPFGHPVPVTAHNGPWSFVPSPGPHRKRPATLNDAEPIDAPETVTTAVPGADDAGSIALQLDRIEALLRDALHNNAEDTTPTP